MVPWTDLHPFMLSRFVGFLICSSHKKYALEKGAQLCKARDTEGI